MAFDKEQFDKDLDYNGPQESDPALDNYLRNRAQFVQQGGMADSFVAEHNARQQNNLQSGGPSLNQPKNDGPELG